jgi:protease PrsW
MLYIKYNEATSFNYTTKQLAMTPLLLLFAIAPGIAISFWIYQQDKYEKEPYSLVLLSFFWGCLSTIPAILAQVCFKGWENPDNFFQMGLYSFFIVALTEELSKFVFLRFSIYPKDAFNEPFDGIVYAVMVGMGFATTENVLYLLNTEGGNSLGLVLGRAFTAVPAHAAFAVMMGSYVGLAKFIPEKRDAYMLSGVVLAVFFHGLYDFFLLQKSYQGLTIVSIIVLSISISLARKLIRMGQEVSPFKDAPYEAFDVVENETPEEKDSAENEGIN